MKEMAVAVAYGVMSAVILAICLHFAGWQLNFGTLAAVSAISFLAGRRL